MRELYYPLIRDICTRNTHNHMSMTGGLGPERELINTQGHCGEGPIRDSAGKVVSEYREICKAAIDTLRKFALAKKQQEPLMLEYVTDRANPKRVNLYINETLAFTVTSGLLKQIKSR